MRETEEELGIDSRNVCALGRLRRIEVTVSKFVVTPFVGWAAAAPQLNINRQEVESVIEVPVSNLMDERLIEKEVRTFRGRRWEITAYRFGRHMVWGATARILADLQARITGVPLNTQWIPGAAREL
ncbi:MAG: hypothetical protein NVSMB52_09880 [Chloroflexota bacterium]